MSPIASATPALESQLADLRLYLETNRTKFADVSELISIDINLDDITEPFHDLITDITDSLHKIVPSLDEYFKNIGAEVKENMDAIVTHVQEIDWSDQQSIMDGLQPILDHLRPVFDFVKENPLILVPLIIPVLMLFFGILGFGTAGVAAGSIAAALQSSIGIVPKGSLFSFFQSAGAGKWAFQALLRANMFITIAVILVAVGKFLIDNGIVDPGEATDAVEGAWNKVVETFDAPDSSLGSQVRVLNLDIAWVKYGLGAWVFVHILMCAGEGIEF